MSTYRPGCGHGSPIGADEIAAAEAWNANAPSYEEQLRAIADDESRPADERDLAKWMLETGAKEKSDVAAE